MGVALPAGLLQTVCKDSSITTNSPIGRPKREGSCLPPRKRLFAGKELPLEAWSEAENKALIEFVLFHCDPAVWPCHSKSSRFWRDAADFVYQRSKSSCKRSGKNETNINAMKYYPHYRILLAGACRLRVVSKYPKQFRCPADAERHFLGGEVHPDTSMEVSPLTIRHKVLEAATQTDLSFTTAGQPTTAQAFEALKLVPKEEQLQMMSDLFCIIANLHYRVHINQDFLHL